MWKGFAHLLKKDIGLMVSGKFFLLALLSLILYSCYINLVYVNLDQGTYRVYLYDPQKMYTGQSAFIMTVNSRQELENFCSDGVSVGIDVSGDAPEIYLLSSGTATADHYRGLWGRAVLTGLEAEEETEIVGAYDKEQKSRREITAEFLFFELSAVGFLGLASIVFKEKQMGVIRVHSVLPVHKAAFILSKLSVFFVSDLIFAVLLTWLNVGIADSFMILPAILVQAGILSLVMALTGFLCAVWLPDFKQFSLFYLILAVFVTTPVFLAGQTGVARDWIVFHPIYHLFAAMKSAYFGVRTFSVLYYFVCIGSIVLLFYAAYRILAREMAKEG
ncbi:MAG: ABC transporter permease [Lachnospiraceae bacterium]|nr:ABC transporter permease [Lachnospiraceae bacterium]